LGILIKPQGFIGDNMSAQLDLDDVVFGSKSELAIKELAQLRSQNSELSMTASEQIMENEKLRNRIKKLENLIDTLSTDKSTLSDIQSNLFNQIAELEANDHEAKSYLSRLVIHFAAEPLDTLLGLCTQIDNMMALIPTWQPIETAPKDGVILLWSNGLFIGFWNKEAEIFVSNNYPICPTHWMPLPEPPK
jgi:hypothetical protein